MTWQPPSGYVPVASRLEGITVYAPAPPVERGPDTQTFKCPQCGATTAFDPSAATVTCAHCGFQQPTQGVVVGAAAHGSEFTLETLDHAARGWGEDRRELHCESCGATLSLASRELASSCPFCASNHVVVRPASSDALRPRYLIPFKIERAECTARVRAWLGRGWMYPKGLETAAQTARFSGLYLSFWAFDARLDSVWRAEVGHPRTRSYFDAGTKSMRTRTEIQWEWKTGRLTLPVENLLVPGTTHIRASLLQHLHPYQLAALVEYSPEFLAGWQAQAYDVTLNKAWDTARADMRERARAACYESIHSQHIRNFSLTADLADETWRYLLLPVWVAAYRFQNHTYQVCVNGQTGQVAGEKPVAWWKVWLVVSALLIPPVVAGVGAFLLPRTPQQGTGGVLLLAGVLFIICGLVAISIISSAMKASEA